MRNLLAVFAVLAVAVGCQNKNGAGDDSDANEVKMSFEQAPAAVREGLTREAGTGATITEVEQEMESGKAVYEADATAADGKKWEITVDENGKLIDKGIDDEEGAGDDD